MYEIRLKVLTHYEFQYYVLLSIWNSQLANHRSLWLFIRSFRGVQLGFCGVLFVSQKASHIWTLETIVPATHSLKVTMFALRFANCSISILLKNSTLKFSQTPRSDHIVKHFFATLFLCEHSVPLAGKKSVRSSMQGWCISCYFFVHTKK